MEVLKMKNAAGFANLGSEVRYALRMYIANINDGVIFNATSEFDVKIQNSPKNV
jgi:hypothetical protein